MTTPWNTEERAGRACDDLVTAMTGEARLDAAAGRTGMPAGEPVLAVTGLSSDRYAGVDFEVGAGEIVGPAGAGGRTEPAGTLVGPRRAVAGRPPHPGDVPAALAAGIGFVPRDRHHQDLVDRTLSRITGGRNQE